MYCPRCGRYHGQVGLPPVTKRLQPTGGITVFDPTKVGGNAPTQFDPAAIKEKLGGSSGGSQSGGPHYFNPGGTIQPKQPAPYQPAPYPGPGGGQPAPMQPQSPGGSGAQPGPMDPQYPGGQGAQPGPMDPQYPGGQGAQPAPMDPQYPGGEGAQPAPTDPQYPGGESAEPAPMDPQYPGGESAEPAPMAPMPDPVYTQPAPPPAAQPAQAPESSAFKTILIAAAPTILAGVVIYYLTRPGER
jgi:hypothetical protein